MDPWVLVGVVAIAVLVVFFRYGCRKDPLVALGVAWFLLFQLPTSNLLWPLAYFAADRYQYAPLAGLVMLVVALCSRLSFGGGSRWIWLPCACLLTVLGGMTWQQSRVWDSEKSLYRQAVKVSPESSSALVGLAMALYNENKLDRAYELARKAVRLNRYESKGVYMLGLINEARGDIAQAKMNFLIFIQADGGRHPRFLRDAQMRLKSYGK